MQQLYNDGLALSDEAFEAAGVAWWTMEIPSGIVFFHANKLRMLGREKEQFVHYQDFVNIVHPDDRDSCMTAMYDLLEGRSNLYETVYRIQHRDGSYKTFYDKGRITQKSEKSVRVSGIVFDVQSLGSKLRDALAE